MFFKMLYYFLSYSLKPNIYKLKKELEYEIVIYKLNNLQIVCKD